MRQSLPDQAHAEAAAHDQVPVMCDRFQMSPEFIHCAALPFFLITLYDKSVPAATQKNFKSLLTS
jgi:hypothetical protein